MEMSKLIRHGVGSSYLGHRVCFSAVGTTLKNLTHMRMPVICEDTHFFNDCIKHVSGLSAVSQPMSANDVDRRRLAGDAM